MHIHWPTPPTSNLQCSRSHDSVHFACSGSTVVALFEIVGSAGLVLTNALFCDNAVNYIIMPTMLRTIIVVFVAFVISSTVSARAKVRDDSCPLRRNLDADVLVLGGGVAGITAAKTLHDGGISDIIVIEALDRIGGRIRRESFGGFEIELGANEIEGVDESLGMNNQSNPLWKLGVLKCGLKGRFVNEFQDTYVTYNGSSVINDTKTVQRLYRAMKASVKDSLKMQRNGEQDRSIRDELSKYGWNPTTPLENTAEWEVIDISVGQTPEKTSTFAALPLPLNHLHGPDNFFVDDQRGYVHIVNCMADDFLSKNSTRLQLNTTVTAISWSDACVCVTVHTNGQEQERELCAKHAIVTFSVGVLQSKEGRALFHPSLPQWKVSAIGRLQYAYFLKIFVKFNETFWNNNISFIHRISKQRGYYSFIQPLGSTKSKILPTNAGILLFYLTGHLAYNVTIQPKNVTQTQIMEVLREMYGNDIPEPEDVLISTWITDPLFRGMFTNVGPGVTDEVYEVAAKPVGNLHFSGEGMCRKYFGTVTGGHISGLATAKAILLIMK